MQIIYRERIKFLKPESSAITRKLADAFSMSPVALTKLLSRLEAEGLACQYVPFEYLEIEDRNPQRLRNAHKEVLGLLKSLGIPLECESHGSDTSAQPGYLPDGWVFAEGHSGSDVIVQAPNGDPGALKLTGDEPFLHAVLLYSLAKDVIATSKAKPAEVQMSSSQFQWWKTQSEAWMSVIVALQENWTPHPLDGGLEGVVELIKTLASEATAYRALGRPDQKSISSNYVFGKHLVTRESAIMAIEMASKRGFTNKAQEASELLSPSGKPELNAVTGLEIWNAMSRDTQNYILSLAHDSISESPPPLHPPVCMKADWPHNGTLKDLVTLEDAMRYGEQIRQYVECQTRHLDFQDTFSAGHPDFIDTHFPDTQIPEIQRG